MWKTSSLALSVMLAGSMLSGYAVQAAEGDASKEVISENQDQLAAKWSDYMKAEGVVTGIEKDGDTLRVTVEDAKESITVFLLKDKSMIFDNASTKEMKPADVKKGDKVTGYYDKNKPMILIYPAEIMPELFFVEDANEKVSVKVSKFDENFLSLDGELQLNLGKETEMVNEEGKAITEKELKDKELVVFYDITTRSIPPQTPPIKVIALDPLSNGENTETPGEGGDGGAVTVPAAIQTIIEKDHHMKNGVKMIPLRKVAEAAGYTVESQPQANGALLTKENRSFTITRGEKKYGFNKSLQQFKEAPALLEKYKTYVSEDFLNLLLGDQ